MIHNLQFDDLQRERSPNSSRSRPKRATIAALALVVLGAAYEAVGEWRDRHSVPRIGRAVDIGGRSLNIYCWGEGSPAVVLDSGRGLPGYSWILVQPQIAKTTSACWYDRAGLGWSDPAPGSRSSDAVAKDLHQLLGQAGIPPPYVLVGHSMGGFNVRVYQRLYPDEVAGLVLVDARQEDMETRVPDMPKSLEALCPRCPRWPLALAVEALGYLGIWRLWSLAADPAPAEMTLEAWRTLTSLRTRPQAMATAIREHSGQANDREMRAAGDLGRLPLLVLTAGRSFADSRRIRADRLATVQQDWIQIQGELARRSSRGRHIVVANSGHMIPYEAPQAVTEAVRDVVRTVRDDSGHLALRTR
jgi:pimeloyl-ACP methyl ester carboxylesterase